MSDSFRSRLEQATADWVDEDIISSDQAHAILQRYQAEGEPDGEDWTTTLLYGTAAVLVGAAALALVYVGLEPQQKLWPLVALGAGLAAAGVGLTWLHPERGLLADVLMGAALAPLAASVWEAGDAVGGAVLVLVAGLGVPSAYLLWRREAPFLPTLSVIGASVASAGVAFEIIEPGVTDAQVAAIWMAMQAGLVLGLIGIDRWLRDEDATVPAALAVLAFAGSLIPFFLESVNIDDSAMVELALGGAMVGVLLAAVPLRHRGLVLGASVAIGIDAIVFAFDVGGAFFGTLLLIGLAIVLIVQAEAVKRWMKAAP